MEKLCSLCKRSVDSENAPILAMGGFGNPRYICDECAKNIELMTTAHDVDTIKENLAMVSEKMSRANVDDTVTLDAMDALLADVKDRAEKINRGEYDFSNDVQELQASGIVGEPEIPEELLETEEDRALDEKEQQQKAKFDKIFNWVALGIIAAAVAAVIIYFNLR